MDKLRAVACFSKRFGDHHRDRLAHERDLILARKSLARLSETRFLSLDRKRHSYQRLRRRVRRSALCQPPRTHSRCVFASPCRGDGCAHDSTDSQRIDAARPTAKRTSSVISDRDGNEAESPSGGRIGCPDFVLSFLVIISGIEPVELRSNAGHARRAEQALRKRHLPLRRRLIRYALRSASWAWSADARGSESCRRVEIVTARNASRNSCPRSACRGCAHSHVFVGAGYRNQPLAFVSRFGAIPS